MSKFCQNCGKPMTDEMNFCQYCGSAYKAPTAQPTYQPASYQQGGYQGSYGGYQSQQTQAPQQPEVTQQPVQPQAPQPTYSQPQAPQTTYSQPQAPQQPPVQQPQVPQETPAQTAPKANGFDFGKLVDSIKQFFSGIIERCKTDKKFMYTCLAGVGAALLCIILLIVATAGAGYKAPIDNAIAIFYQGDFDKIEKLVPKEALEVEMEEADMDLDELIEELEDQYGEVLETLEDTYGAKYKVTYTITDEKELSEKRTSGIAEVLAEEYDLDEKGFTAAYDLELEIYIEGPDDDNDEEIEISVIKYKGSWYLIEWSRSGKEYYADFDPSAIVVPSFFN